MIQRAKELDRRLVKIARTVKVLSAVAWPEAVVQTFLDSWRRGAPALPTPPLPADRFTDQIEALDALMREADRADPLQHFVARTAASFATAARMIHAAGTPAFSTLSRQLYGAPGDTSPGAPHTHREAASRLLDITAPLAEVGVCAAGTPCVGAEAVRATLQSAFASFFGDDAPNVVIDDELASKAAAGARRVRIRGGTCFTDNDAQQLIEHEGLVHSATAINGSAQPVLGCMALSSPRTTSTQEGLATFAELITRTMDVPRLRRIALRVAAIDMALDGADFIDVFRFFLEQGQREDESAHSAMRVFRGGDVGGSVAFTKDAVYLAGLLEVHAFLRRAIVDNRPHVVAQLFAGRLHLDDVDALRQNFDDGSVVAGRFVPPWARDMQRLAAYLAFSSVANWIDREQPDATAS